MNKHHLQRNGQTKGLTDRWIPDNLSATSNNPCSSGEHMNNEKNNTYILVQKHKVYALNNL